MINSKLLLILKSLSKTEWNALEKFIHSPFYNQREDVRKLFLLLKKGDLDQIDEEKIFKTVYKNQPFDKVQSRYLRSFLLKVVEQFLAYQEWQSDQFNTEISLAQVYRKKGLNKIFQNKIKQLQKKQQSSIIQNGGYFQNTYQLELEIYTWTENQTRRGDMNLQQLSDSLDHFYIIEKLKRSCTLLTHQAVYKTVYETGLLDMLLEYIPKNNLLEIPAISIYYHSYLALKHPTQIANFDVLKSLIQEHSDLFPLSEFRNIYLLAINFCIRQINMGNTSFVKELFDLYRKGLKNKALLENGQLSRWTYKNIVAIGLGLQEYEWIDEFIHYYKNLLPVAYQENSFHYNLAELHYHRQEYDEAMKLLFVINDKDLLLLLSAKMLLCKVYYALEEWKLLDSHLHSFDLFVRRQKKIGYHKQNYLNFTLALKKVIALNTFELKEVQKLQLFIQDMKRLPERKWLLSCF